MYRSLGKRTFREIVKIHSSYAIFGNNETLQESSEIGNGNEGERMGCVEDCSDKSEFVKTFNQNCYMCRVTINA